MNYYTYLLIDPDTMQPFYVGKGVGRRMYEHHRVRGRLINPLLKNKICKLHDEGKQIVYEKVLVNVDEPTAFKKEQELIQQYGRKIDRSGILCNMTVGGEGNSSSWTEKRKQEQSNRMKGKMGNLKVIQKAVSQYSLDGKHFADFPSAKVASECVVKANQSYITQVCKGKRKSAGGFMWTYKGDPVSVFTKAYYRPVEQYSLDGKLLQAFQSLTHAQTTTGIELHNISEACRGNSKTAGGFIWRYA